VVKTPRLRPILPVLVSRKEGRAWLPDPSPWMEEGETEEVGLPCVAISSCVVMDKSWWEGTKHKLVAQSRYTTRGTARKWRNFRTDW
jgi:hypothetical protein